MSCPQPWELPCCLSAVFWHTWLHQHAGGPCPIACRHTELSPALQQIPVPCKWKAPLSSACQHPALLTLELSRKWGQITAQENTTHSLLPSKVPKQMRRTVLRAGNTELLLYLVLTPTSPQTEAVSKRYKALFFPERKRRNPVNNGTFLLEIENSFSHCLQCVASSSFSQVWP